MKTKHRHLRPWVTQALQILVAVVTVLLLGIMFCHVVEAFTGFNPMWLAGSM